MNDTPQGREMGMRQEGNDYCPWESSAAEDKMLLQVAGHNCTQARSCTLDNRCCRRRWLILRQISLHKLLDLTKGWQLARCRETHHN